jgi:hypothetical protein
LVQGTEGEAQVFDVCPRSTELNQIGARGEDGEAEATEVSLDTEVLLDTEGKLHWDDTSSPFVPRNILQVTYWGDLVAYFDVSIVQNCDMLSSLCRATSYRGRGQCR